MSELLESLGGEEAERDAALATDSAAVAMALDRKRTGRAGKRADAAADRFLAAQEALVSKQLHHLDEQFRNLGLDRWSKRLRLMLQVLTILVGVLVLAGVGFMAWRAHEADGVVIETFSVPPDLAARGLTGQVLASQVEDRLNALQAATFSARPAASYSNNWGHDIKVEIPETGVSVGELQRVLREWLGHETRISGEVFRSPQGLSLTIRNDEGGQTVSGPDDQLDALLQRGAEALYARTEPFRYAAWLNGQKRDPEAAAVLEKLIADGPASERPWALSALANLQTDPARRLALAQRAVALDPKLAVAWLALANACGRLGEADRADAAERRFLALVESAGRGGVSPKTVIAAHDARATLAGDVADWQTVRREDTIVAEQAAEPQRRVEGAVNAAFAAASMHEATEARRLQGGSDDAKVSQVLGYPVANGLMGAFWIQDWAEVVRQGQGLIAIAEVLPHPEQAKDYVRQRVLPPMSTALVRLGRRDEAQALIAQMPQACDFCRQDRAAQLAMAGDVAGSERAWAEMIRRNPKYVFPYNWRAVYRLERGDYDGAIAATRATNKLGPRWADPLEIWAEALAAKGDLAGAAAKYQQAALYAPRWGHLHLKWGEALARLGRHDAARAKFQAAATMDLGPADRAELAAQKR